MLYIITALYAEASPFIKHYNLKRDRLMKRHELYFSEHKEVCLLITKPGKISAATALTELLVTHTPTEKDYLVNLGVCGICENAYNSDSGIPPVYICTDILDHDTGRHYYLDMLFKHPFRESGIETCSVVINNKELVSMPLVDMEASAIYQAGASFFSPHQMIFLKIPSDELETSFVTRDMITETIINNLPIICAWLDNFLTTGIISDDKAIQPTNFTPAEQALFDDISNRLNLSVTMTEQLRQLFIYHKLTKGNLDGIALPELPEGRITNQKRTILFEQFRQQFLQ